MPSWRRTSEQVWLRRLAQLQADIRHALFRFVWVDSDTDPRLRWITTNCFHLSKRYYDCVPANAG
jgi:hypothetical protein